MKRFEYLAPNSLDEALDLLSGRPEATVLAGGTNILVQLKERHREESALLSVKRIAELHELQHGEVLRIGAAVTMRQLASDPVIKRDYGALATAAGLLGSVQTRNMATVGGNICNASPSAETAPPLLALEAQLVLISLDGQRTIPLEEFFLGPGETVLHPGEILKEIRVPTRRAQSGSSYVRHIPRQAMDISVAGVSTSLALDEEGKIIEARIALGAVAATPMLATRAAACLIGQNPAPEHWAKAGSFAAEEADPIEDLRASISYRRHLVKELTVEALHASLDDAMNR